MPAQLNAKVKGGLVLFLLYLVPPDARRAHIAARPVSVAGGIGKRLPNTEPTSAVSGGWHMPVRERRFVQEAVQVQECWMVSASASSESEDLARSAKRQGEGGLGAFSLYLVPPNARRAHIPSPSDFESQVAWAADFRRLKQLPSVCRSCNQYLAFGILTARGRSSPRMLDAQSSSFFTRFWAVAHLSNKSIACLGASSITPFKLSEECLSFELLVHRRFRLVRHRNLKILPGGKRRLAHANAKHRRIRMHDVMMPVVAVSGGWQAKQWRIRMHDVMMPVEVGNRLLAMFWNSALDPLPANFESLVAWAGDFPTLNQLPSVCREFNQYLAFGISQQAVSGGWHMRECEWGFVQEVSEECLSFELLVHRRFRLVRHRNLKILPVQLNAKVKGGLVLFLLYLVPPNARAHPRRAKLESPVAVSGGWRVGACKWSLVQHENVRAQECWMAKQRRIRTHNVMMLVVVSASASSESEDHAVQLNVKMKRGLVLFQFFILCYQTLAGHTSPPGQFSVGGGTRRLRLVRHRNLKITPVQLNAKAVSGGWHMRVCEWSFVQEVVRAQESWMLSLILSSCALRLCPCIQQKHSMPRFRLLHHRNLKIIPVELNAHVKGGFLLFLLYLVPPTRAGRTWPPVQLSVGGRMGRRLQNTEPTSISVPLMQSISGIEEFSQEAASGGWHASASASSESEDHARPANRQGQGRLGDFSTLSCATKRAPGTHRRPPSFPQLVGVSEGRRVGGVLELSAACAPQVSADASSECEDRARSAKRQGGKRRLARFSRCPADRIESEECLSFELLVHRRCRLVRHRNLKIMPVQLNAKAVSGGWHMRAEQRLTRMHDVMMPVVIICDQLIAKAKGGLVLFLLYLVPANARRAHIAARPVSRGKQRLAHVTGWMEFGAGGRSTQRILDA
ncbi:hypothetical protein Efla_002383 [Eimeria flavescens]